MVAATAREYRPRADKPDAWKDVAFNYAESFIAWYDLTHLLTPAVRTEARRVYGPGEASIKLGAGNRTAPVVPAMPEGVMNLVAQFRRVELDATPFPTVIEALVDGLGIYFRNALYAGRRHPLEPDTKRVTIEAKACATARQVAQSKPAEPIGWGADYDELMKQETRVAVRARLGIKNRGDAQDLMMNEWKAQDPARGESALSLLRCDSINFAELRMQLIREAEAVMAAASKPNAPELLARLEAAAAAVDPGALDRVAERAAAKAVEAIGARDDDDAPAAKLPELKPIEKQAWALLTLQGMTQEKVAAALNKEHGKTITQGQVSRMFTRVKAHAKLNGLADKVPKRAERARVVDPARTELGARTDKRKPRPSDMAQADDEDE
jgi:hypothetical protein